MGSLSRDHKVEYKTGERIRADALSCREAGKTENRPRFNITAYVTEILCPRYKYGRITLYLFRMKSENDDPAYVVFKKSGTPNYREIHLYVDEDVWALASLGDPRSVYIIAHEIGHIILRHHYITAFSDDPSVRAKWAGEGCSAEDQADTFAKYFLLPDHIVDQFYSVERLLEFCDVEEWLAEERFNDRTRAGRGVQFRQDGDPCEQCGNLLVRIGRSLTCGLCGAKTATA